MKNKNIVLKILVILFISIGWVMANSIAKTGNPFSGIVKSDLIFGNLLLFLFMAIVLSGIIYGLEHLNKKRLTRFEDDFSWWKVWVLLLIFWAPYVMLAFPGVVGWDGADQLNAFFQVNMPQQAIHFYGTNYNFPDQQFYLTNHHPLMSSLFLATLFSLGKIVFQNANGAIATVVLGQYILMSLSITYLIMAIKIWQKPFLKLVLVFFAFFPVFPLVVVNVNKTALLLAVYALFIGALLRIISSENKNQIVVFTVATTILLLVRNDTIILLMVLLLMIPILKLPLKKIYIASAIALVIFIGWNKFLLPAAKVLPAEPVEALAVPSQQIAYTLIHNPKAYTKQDVAMLKKVADLDAMKRSYTDGAYDPVKHTFYYYPDGFWQKGKTYEKARRLLENAPIVKYKSYYFKVWFNGLLKSPTTYVEAYLLNYYHYFYFGDMKTNIDLLYQGGFVDYEHTTLFNGLDYKESLGRKNLSYWADIQQTVPVLKTMLTTGFWGVTVLLMLVLAVEKKNKSAILLTTLSLGSIVVGMLSPVDGYLRYVMPLMVSMPIIFVILFQRKPEA
jgi:Predicted membrane protein